MTRINHAAVFISNKTNKANFIQQLLHKKAVGEFAEFNKLNGVLFSAITIKEIIEEEERHGLVQLSTTANRHLRTFSAGEQKKALLAHLLSGQPGYIIADGPFDNLDTASQISLQQRLKEIATFTPIIQLINRFADVLSFINKAFSINDNNEVLQHSSVNEYILELQSKSGPAFNGSIPASNHHYSGVSNPLVEFKNVTVKYDGRTIVKDINWQINTREFWQLVGPNGSGKTTLLSLISGDNTKGYGQDLILFGKKKGSGESVWSIKEKTGYFTPSITELFSRYTTVEQMVISGFFDSVGLYAKPSRQQIKLADAWLGSVDLLPLKKALFHTLSPARQRMVMIVRAMVKHPPLLILDEPMAGLDDANVAVVSALINKISAESNTAILYVSHRTEKTLAPQFNYELMPGAEGSTGRVR